MQSRLQAIEFYRDTLANTARVAAPLGEDAVEAAVHEVMAELDRTDLFYLLTHTLNRTDINCDFLYDRVRTVEAEPDGMLDLWSREHYKSTIITFGLTIQDILKDPEVTCGIFSHTRPIAKAFLGQIMQEFEQNNLLKALHPDVLWANPRREAPWWSLDSGIVVKRKTNPKEATVEAWGLVDGQPTSKHFSRQIYDDVVTLASVTTPEQIAKTTEAWAISLNLGAHGGVRRYIGTRYHFNDTWGELIRRGSATPRIVKSTVEGTPDGTPVFLTKEALAEKYRDMGPYVFGCQMNQDPTADTAMGFKEEWLRRYNRMTKVPTSWNLYLLCDPASEKKKGSDYTVMVVLGLAPDGNTYLLDGIRDRLNLVERANKFFHLHRKWRPHKSGYEKYGMQADIEHFKHEMETRNYRFDIVELGGNMPKNDRIRRLVPPFAAGTFFIPWELLFVDYEGKAQDFCQLFVDHEYLPFPVANHDDMLDCISRIKDPALGAEFPLTDEEEYARESYHPTTANTEYDLHAYR